MTSQTLFIDSFGNALDTIQFLRQKTQGKDIPVHVTKAYRGIGGIIPLILNLGTLHWAKAKQSLYRSGQALKFPGG
jgi:hypothetical protein